METVFYWWSQITSTAAQFPPRPHCNCLSLRLQAHGRKSTTDHAYSYSHRCSAGTKTHRTYRGSSAGKFHDGIDYRFFNNRDAPEMPAEVYLAKEASPPERSVRQKLLQLPQARILQLACKATKEREARRKTSTGSLTRNRLVHKYPT